MKKKDFLEEVDLMSTTIIAHLNDLISNDEECVYHITVTNENATEFFTALNNAICYLLTKTGMCNSMIDAHHLYNKLYISYRVQVELNKAKQKQ